MHQSARPPAYWSAAVRDIVGAGDAFLAGLLSGLLAPRGTLESALDSACRLSEFVAARDGATPSYQIDARGIRVILADGWPPPRPPTDFPLAMKFSWFFVIVLLVVVAIFSVQNAAPMTVRFLKWEFVMSAALVIQLAALLGGLVGLGFGVCSRRSPRPNRSQPVPLAEPRNPPVLPDSH